MSIRNIAVAAAAAAAVSAAAVAPASAAPVFGSSDIDAAVHNTVNQANTAVNNILALIPGAPKLPDAPAPAPAPVAPVGGFNDYVPPPYEASRAEKAAYAKHCEKVILDDLQAYRTGRGLNTLVWDEGLADKARRMSFASSQIMTNDTIVRGRNYSWGGSFDNGGCHVVRDYVVSGNEFAYRRGETHWDDPTISRVGTGSYVDEYGIYELYLYFD